MANASTLAIKKLLKFNFKCIGILHGLSYTHCLSKFNNCFTLYCYKFFFSKMFCVISNLFVLKCLCHYNIEHFSRRSHNYV